MKNSYEKELPQGYEETLHINAGDKKTGLIFNAVALLTMAVVAVIVVLTKRDDPHWFWQIGLFGVGVLVYTVLHELVHGIAYKALTGQKLTFGLKWSCAFCGVPEVYVYRQTALIALLAPFTVFSLVLLPTAVVLGVIGSPFYLSVGLLFGMHLGGCCGDLYMAGLLGFKYRDGDVLVRDTGPEQWLYVKNKKETKLCQ